MDLLASWTMKSVYVNSLIFSDTNTSKKKMYILKAPIKFLNKNYLYYAFLKLILWLDKISPPSKKKKVG